MVGVGRDLCGSSSSTPLPKQGHLEQAAQDLVQVDLEYLQRRRLHNLPGQPLNPTNAEEPYRVPICYIISNSAKKSKIFASFYASGIHI